MHNPDRPAQQKEDGQEMRGGGELMLEEWISQWEGARHSTLCGLRSHSQSVTARRKNRLFGADQPDRPGLGMALSGVFLGMHSWWDRTRRLRGDNKERIRPLCDARNVDEKQT